MTIDEALAWAEELRKEVEETGTEDTRDIALLVLMGAEEKRRADAKQMLLAVGPPDGGIRYLLESARIYLEAHNPEPCIENIREADKRLVQALALISTPSAPASDARELGPTVDEWRIADAAGYSPGGKVFAQKAGEDYQNVLFWECVCWFDGYRAALLASGHGEAGNIAYSEGFIDGRAYGILEESSKAKPSEKLQAAVVEFERAMRAEIVPAIIDGERKQAELRAEVRRWILSAPSETAPEGGVNRSR